MPDAPSLIELIAWFGPIGYPPMFCVGFVGAYWLSALLICPLFVLLQRLPRDLGEVFARYTVVGAIGWSAGISIAMCLAFYAGVAETLPATPNDDTTRARQAALRGQAHQLIQYAWIINPGLNYAMSGLLISVAGLHAWDRRSRRSSKLGALAACSNRRDVRRSSN